MSFFIRMVFPGDNDFFAPENFVYPENDFLVESIIFIRGVQPYSR